MLRQIILDTETTGLDIKSGHRIIEIGCIELINRRFTGEEFHSYLNPDRKIDEGAEKVHGITLDFLKDKPRFNEIFDNFKDFIKDSELLIHNAEFDVRFLDHEIGLLSGNQPVIANIVHKVTDTLQIAREKHPGQRNSLDALVQRYEIRGYDRELHGALLDSKILGDVYLLMTGGQGDLLFQKPDLSDQDLKKSEEDKDKLLSPKQIPTIKTTESEEQAHLNYLKKMQQETGKKPLWLTGQKDHGNSK